MKFVDEVRIEVKAGDGGDGAVAFRREKFIEKGGPSGGDGGNGGSIIFEVDPQLTTLLDFRYQQHHTARGGGHGLGSDCNGANADDMVLKVPVGTIIRDHKTGELLADLSQPGQRVVVAKGGRGGLGNINFATSTRQTPRFAQDGTPGEHKILMLELRLLADVGLLGYPNAGKSTLIARISRARPKIADYPFTTLVPNLGVVAYKDRLSFVVADIPGLIEGASEGVGLGLQFLRHVERCRALVHVVDLSAGVEGRDPIHDFDVINKELARYSPALAAKPQVMVANKLDLPHAREALPPFVAAMKKRRITVFPISGATGEGVGPVLDAVAQVLFAKAEPKPRLSARRPAPKKVVAKIIAKKAAKPRKAKAPKRAKRAKKPSAKKGRR
jgi:GTP-binding protein